MSDDLRQKAIDLLVADIIRRVKADDAAATLEVRALVAEKLGASQTRTLSLSNFPPLIGTPYNAPSILDRTLTPFESTTVDPNIRVTCNSSGKEIIR